MINFMVKKLQLHVILSGALLTSYVSLSAHEAHAEGEDTTVKLEARKVSGDAQASAKIFKRLLNKGRKLTREERYQEAITAYQEALTYDPNNAKALGELGFTAQKMKQYKLAEKLAQLCVRQSQSNKIKGSCYYNLGRALESQGDPKSAARAYAESLSARPGNKAVKKRLTSLKVTPKVAEKPACLGVTCQALTWQAVCPHLKKVATQSLGGGDEDSAAASCKKIGSRRVSEALLKGVALVQSELMGEALYFVVFQVDAGWVPAGIVGYSYNPGAFGIYEEISLKMALRDVIGGDKMSELIVHTTVNRYDSDMGIEEEEHGEVVLEHICELESEGLKARCYGPRLRSRSYTRERLSEAHSGSKSGVLTRERYRASIEYPTAGSIRVKRVKGKFKAAESELGIHPIRALPKSEVSIYTR